MKIRGVAFYDPSGNLLSNVTFTLMEVPEPTAGSLLSIGLIFFLGVAIQGCDGNVWVRSAIAARSNTVAESIYETTTLPCLRPIHFKIISHTTSVKD